MMNYKRYQEMDDLTKTKQSLIDLYRFEIKELRKTESPNDSEEFLLAFSFLRAYPILISHDCSGRGLPLHVFTYNYHLYSSWLMNQDSETAKTILSRIQAL